VACVAFDLPYLPLRFSDKTIVRSSAETGWIPLSPLVGIPVPANELSTSAFSSRSKKRKTNATNATHASKPYAVRLSGCGVCPSKRHTCHPNATPRPKTPHSSCVTSWPRFCHSALLQGSDRHLRLRGETVLQRRRKSVLLSSQSLVTSPDRAHRAESLQRTGIPSMGSL